MDAPNQVDAPDTVKVDGLRIPNPGGFDLRGAVTPSIALILLLGSVGRLAGAEETSPPTIEHDRISTCAKGEPLVIQARIVSTAGKKIFTPAVYVKLSGADVFTKLSMQPHPTAAEIFVARLPASFTEQDFSYYVEAYDEDGNGPSRAGSPEAPYSVTVKTSGTPVAVPTTAVSATSAPPSSPAETRHIAGFVIGGVGIAAGASGVILGILANAQAADARNTPQIAGLAAYNSAANSAKTLALGADISYLTAIVGIGVGAWLAFGSSSTPTDASHEESRLEIETLPVRGGAALSLQGRF
jgi:hypothetical protein